MSTKTPPAKKAPKASGKHVVHASACSDSGSGKQPSTTVNAQPSATVNFPTLPSGQRQSLPTALIHRHPHNRKIDPKTCAGLADSMRLFGQIQPSVVRPHPEKPGHYQLGAGERRWIAADLNGQELDCLICDLTDAQIEGLLVIENHQRENPDPRHEATQIRRFTQAHPEADTHQLAAMLGRDESWVKRRLRLLDLIEPVHEAWVDPENNIHSLPIASMELIAQLSAEHQAEFLEEWTDYGSIDHGDVVHWIASIGCQLDKATWLENPATFIPGCGPGCGPGCATSTAATDLFANTEFADQRVAKCAQCLNPACFKQRSALARTHAWQLVLEKAPEGHYAITDRYSHPEVTLYDNSTLKPKQRHDFHGWANCKKSDPDAKPFIEEKDDTVKLTWKKPPPGATTLPPAAGETVIKSPEESLQASIDRLQGKRYTLLLDELRDHVAKAPIPEFNDINERGIYGMVHLAACFGTHIRLNYVHGYIHDLDHGNDANSAPLTDDELAVDDEAEPEADTPGFNPKPTAWDRFRQTNTSHHVDLLWKSIRKVLSERLRDRSYTDKKSTLIKPEFIQEMREVAQLTAFNFTAAYLRACTQKIPAPLKHLDPITLTP